jgi:hypothetical protein
MSSLAVLVQRKGLDVAEQHAILWLSCSLNARDVRKNDAKEKWESTANVHRDALCCFKGGFSASVQRILKQSTSTM